MSYRVSLILPMLVLMLLLTLVGGSLWGLLGFRLVFTLAAGAAINAFYPVLQRFAGADLEVSHENTVDQCR